MIFAAFRYFAIVFALGFALGTIRTLVIAPRVGETAAVLMELPLMLAASWIVAHRLVRRTGLAAGTALAMGALAFLLLMFAEAALATTLGNQTLIGWFAGLFLTPGWIGLAGQVAFGAFPFVAARRLKPADIPT